MAAKGGKKIAVRWVRSQICQTQRQRATLRGLGLRRLNHRVVLEDSPSVQGMIDKVRHLIAVEEA
jgi:large subunit ribosomal protein L30